MKTHDFRYFWLWQLLGWLIVAAIVVLSLTPQAPQIGNFQMSDKLGHILAYAIGMGWFATLYSSTKQRVAYALFFVGLGIALEFVQGLTAYRQLEAFDMLADAAGVMLGYWIRQPLLAPFDRNLARVLR